MSFTQVNLALSETRPVNQLQAQKTSGPSVAVVLSYDQRFLLRRWRRFVGRAGVLIIKMRKPKFRLDNQLIRAISFGKLKKIQGRLLINVFSLSWKLDKK